MSLTAAEIAEIVKLLEDSSFDELSLEMNGLKLRLKRRSGSDAAEANAVASSAPLAPAPAPARPAPVSSTVADANVHEVTSPLLGTFYRAPRPGVSPFVDVGTSVEADTVICIIEVMKLMNTVRAGVRGTVAQILVADGTLVEYGQALMRVSRAP